MKNHNPPVTHKIASINSMNPFTVNNSSPRGVMFMSHVSQHLVLNNPDLPYVISGVEKELGKYTFNVKVENNCTIVGIPIERYPVTSSHEVNIETILIVENENKVLDYISIPYYKSMHQYFGYKFKFNQEVINNIYPGANLTKDTIIADSPGVDSDGMYRYGVNLNTVFLSTPDVAEDGFVIARSVIDKLDFNIYETRQISFGKKYMPVNLYGNLTNYKIFPDIGEAIREDGLLMLLRTYDDDLSVVNNSIYDLQEPDMIFDKKYYTRPGIGRVIGIEVIKNPSVPKTLPELARKQLERYAEYTRLFYSKIISTYEHYRNQYKIKYNTDAVPLSDKLHRLLVTAYAITGEISKYSKDKLSVNLQYKNDDLDEFTVKIIVEYNIKINKGFKITDRNGGKGVIVKIVDDEYMPVDKNGRRAELIADAGSCVNRMNFGRLYEHYFNAVSVENRDKLLYMFQNVPLDSYESFVSYVSSMTDTVDYAINYLTELYSLISVKQYNWMLSLTKDKQLQHLYEVLTKGLYIYFPVDNEITAYDATIKIENSRFKPIKDTLTVKTPEGYQFETVEKIRIAPLYIMLLEKIADSWSSVSTAKLQHFGLLSPTSKSEKSSYNFRNNPIRSIGETEARIFASYCDKEAIAEMMDRSNSIFSQKMAVWNILSSKQPTNIDELIDRNIVEFGSTRPLELVKHVLTCMGIEIAYNEDA